MSAVKLSDNVWWVGVKDPGLVVFDIIMQTRYGTTYNSYLVKGSEKIALIDTVKRPFSEEFFANVNEIVSPDKIDYLIVNHTEPDHSGSILELLDKNPNLEIICAAAAQPFVKNVLNREAHLRRVKDKEKIDLGGKTLVFRATPYMHWPDTMMEYLEQDKILFSCDGFAAHVSSDEIFADEVKVDDLDHEIWYYFDMIMRPYTSFISKHMAKLSEHDIEMIAPSHGPIFRQDAQKHIDRYAEWSRDKSEGSTSVVIFHVSSYGNTSMIAEALGNSLQEYGMTPVLLDVLEMDQARAREEIEKAKAVMFGTPTFNGDAVKPIWDAVALMSTVHTFGKKVGVFGSYGWSGEGTKLVADRLNGMRMKVFPENFRARLVPSDDDMSEVKRFASKFADFALGDG